ALRGPRDRRESRVAVPSSRLLSMARRGVLMARRSTVKLIQKSSGLFSQPDPLELPEGAFERLENVWLTREGLIESRRGLARFGGAAAAQVRALLEYRDRLIRHQGTKLEYDANGSGNWTAYSGNFSAPDSDHRIRGVEARKNHYFTTSTGVMKQDALDAEPVRSGIPEALDIRLAATGKGGVVFLGDTQVFYQALFGRIDANDRLRIGAPTTVEETITNVSYEAAYSASGTTVTVTLAGHGFSNGDTIVIEEADDPTLDGAWTISNVMTDTFDFTASGEPNPTSGNLIVSKSFDVELTAPIPDDVVAGDFIEIYRTRLSPSAVTAPSQEFFKVTRH